MSKFKIGNRVRVVRNLYPEVDPVFDLIGLEGTAVGMTAPLGWVPSVPGVAPAPTWVRVSFPEFTEIFHPDELEVIQP